MPKTTVRENETLDDALRRFKRQVNKAGIIQVIGKDGKVLKTKVISSSQSGERIKLETLK